jgi:hypothetical protein
MTTIDLTSRFGEGWCVTVADLPAEQMLIRMGVPRPASVPDGPEYLTARLTPWPAREAGGIALVARGVDPDRAGDRRGGPGPTWAVGLELDGTAGWFGEDREVLGRLSGAGGRAVTILSDPNRTDLLYAEDGRVRGGLDTVGDHSWGSLPPGCRAPEDDSWAGASSERRAVLALRALSGVTLDHETFAGPWLGGIAGRRAR